MKLSALVWGVLFLIAVVPAAGQVSIDYGEYPHLESIVPGNASGFDVEGDYLYTTDRLNGFDRIRVYDITRRDQPVVAAEIQPVLTADVDVAGSMLYAADPQRGLHVYDVSDPYAPQEASPDSTGLLCEYVAVADGKVYILTTRLADEPDDSGAHETFYRLEILPIQRDEALSGVDGHAPPAAVTLDQSYPNPLNPATTIGFNLPQAGRARLKIYDIRGRLVKTLVDGHRAAGRHEEVWAGRDDSGRSCASGVYFYRLDSAGYSETKRMVLVK